MIKPCVYTESLSPDVPRALELAEELGVYNVDLRALYGHSLSDITDDEVGRIRRVVQERPVEISCLSSVVFGKGLTIDDDELYRDQLTTFRRMVEVCVELEVPLLRIFSIDKPNAEVWNDRPDPASYLDKLVARLEPAVRIAESAGVVIGVETEGECYVGTSEEARTVLDALDSPYFKVCWDVLNAWRSGEVAYPGGYEHVRGHVVHLHCKDAPTDPKTGMVGRHDRCLLGEGGIPYSEIFAALARDGYDGLALAERHYSRQNSSADQSEELFREISAEIEAIRGWIASSGASR